MAAIAAGLAILGILIAFFVWPLFNPSPMDEAIVVLEENERFESATEAGVAFARVSSVLLAGAEECDRADEPPQECERLFTAAASAQVTAASVLRCTRPAIFDARKQMIAYLKELDMGESPQPPPLPNCE